jgi:hypothetical protein
LRKRRKEKRIEKRNSKKRKAPAFSLNYNLFESELGKNSFSKTLIKITAWDLK